MKLATVEDAGGRQRIVSVDTAGGRGFGIAQAARRHGAEALAFGSMLALIDAGHRGLDGVSELLAKRGGEEDLWTPMSQLKLRAPVPEPRQMRDGMSFALHIRQAGRGAQKIAAAGNLEKLAELEAAPLPELPAIYRMQPFYYITNRFTVSGPDDTIYWPRYSKVMDYELEFGVFTCGTVSDIPLAKAREHIFGFTIFNDFSARDAQGPEMQSLLGPSKGKSFDGSNGLGPWIVTYDEIGDPYDLATQVRVNGEIRSQGRTQGMLFNFEEILAHASKDETIQAGEFFGSGTVGNGCGLEIGKFLKDGDTVELDVEKIGILSNTGGYAEMTFGGSTARGNNPWRANSDRHLPSPCKTTCPRKLPRTRRA